MNSLPEWLRAGNEDLRPTPTIGPSQATLEALHKISPFPFPVFPILEDFSQLWARPGVLACLDRSLKFKIMWQEWKEELYQGELSASRRTQQLLVETSEPSPSSRTERMSTTSKVKNGQATLPQLFLLPSPPRSDTPDDTSITSQGSSKNLVPQSAMLTTSQVQNRAEGRKAIGQALVSVRNRRPEAWREAAEVTMKEGEAARVVNIFTQGG